MDTANILMARRPFVVYVAAMAMLPVNFAAVVVDNGRKAPFFFATTIIAVVAGIVAAKFEGQRHIKLDILSIVFGLLRCLLTFVIAGGVYHCILVLMGAPVFTDVEGTSKLAAVLATSTVVPAVVVNRFNVLGFQRLRLMMLLSSDHDVDIIASEAAACSLVGAVAGAVTLALDWGVWWQEWPLPCVFGALAGYGVGIVISSGRCLSKWYRRCAKPPERCL
eukprot:m.209232 g.209232  ORF g.209232 m.209232 type:complete len:221 (-) comp18971_c0_seq1:1946-2608(-)